MFWAAVLSIFGLKFLVADNHLEKCSNPGSPDQSILFIGNSFTYYDNMPLIFSNLAKVRFPKRELKVFFQAGPGYALWQHARDKETRPVLMQSGKWDFVVLQEQSEAALHPGTLKSMQQSCRWFDKRIKEVGGKTALLMTWCDLDKQQDQLLISQAYRNVARELGAVLIPAGELFVEVTQKDPTIKLYDEDKHHPSHYGSYLVACLSEAILLQTKSELVDIVNNRQQNKSATPKNPIEQKLQDYADEFAIREMSHPQ